MSNGNFSEIVGDSGEKAIEPLVMALDRYSTMLDQIAFSLDNVGPTIDKAATSFRGVSFSSIQGPVPPRQVPVPVPPSNPTLTYSTYIPKPPTIPSPAVNPRLNPELDIALGLVPEPPTPVVPPTPAPAIPQVSVPQVALGLATEPPTPIPATRTIAQPEQVAAPDMSPIVEAMNRFSEMIDRATDTIQSFVRRIESNNRSIAAPPTPPPIPPIPRETGRASMRNDDGGIDSFRRAMGPTIDGTRRLATSVLRTNILFSVLGETLRRVTDLFRPLGETVNLLGEVFQPLIDAISGMMRIILGPVMIGYKALSVLVSSLLTPIQLLLDKVGVVIDTISDFLDTIDLFGKAQRAAANATNEAFKTIRTTIKNLLTDPLSAVPALLNQIYDAVQTFNPGAMLEFELALRDAKAVFGEALLPIVRILTDVIRRFADTLRPILQKLQPQFEKLARSLGEHLIRNVDLLSIAIERMIPLFEKYLFYETQNLEIARKKRDEQIQRQDPLTNLAKGIAAQNAPAPALEAPKKTFLKMIGDLFVPIPQFGGMLAGQAERPLEARIGDKMRGLQKDLEIAKAAGNKAEIKVAEEKLKALNSLYEIISKQGTRFEFLQKADPEKLKNDKAYQEALKAFMDSMKSVEGNLFLAEKGRRIGPEEKAKNLENANKRMAEAQGNLAKEMDRIIKEGHGPGAAMGLAAPMNPQYKAIADLTRETMLSAFIATSVAGGDDKKQQDDNARKNVAALPKVIEDAVVAAMQIIKEKQAAAPGEPAFGRGVA